MGRMPFTLSHPAAVLPFLAGARARGPLVASALIAGSMAPDLPFFADSLAHGAYRHGALAHRWWAVPTVDVVLAGALVAGWHGLLREPLVALLPERWAGAAEAMTARGGAGGGLERAGWFAVSAAVGAATHVGWDGFTHSGRYGVALLPVLDSRVAGVPLYTVLQYGSSAVALGYLARYAAREARRVAPAPAPVPAPGARRAGAAVLGAATVAGVVHRLARRERGLIAEVCFGAGAGLAVGAVGYATAVRLFTVRRGARPDSAPARPRRPPA